MNRIRLTGGEPLTLRHKLVALLTRLTDSEGRAIEVTLTSNEVLLAQKAQALRDAGLS
jgi:cyclic pyranopterin phosphate synthase